MTASLGPTIDALLAQRAASHGDAPFLRFADGDLSFAAVDRRVSALAGGFANLGIGRSDLVPVLLPNCADFVAVWFALCRLGAVATLVNTAFRGAALAHALNLSGAATVVADGTLAAELDPALPTVRRLVLRGDDPGVTRWPVIDLASLASCDGAPPAPGHRVTDPAMVMFTSGTTGPSKGCVLSHRYGVRQAELMVEHLRLRPDDVLYSPFPLFHVDAAIYTVMVALVLGTTAAIGERFSASGFWEEVRRFGATVFDFMGATLMMTHKQPARPDDADNPARLGWGVPLPDFAPDFEARFGVRLVELYGSTDAGIPVYQPLDEPRRPGSCGRPIAAYDVQLHDEWGQAVPVGATGEIVVRPNEAGLMSDGYFGMAEASLASRRDLWFHTGDLARADADGHLYFVGRRTDSIRRRGENISAFEVEEVVLAHLDVADAAAYGVPSELTEDDVMVAVVARPGAVIDPAELAAFCTSRMAGHMVPRYIDVVADLPRTPTEKVEKRTLVERGVTPTTWDRTPRKAD